MPVNNLPSVQTASAHLQRVIAVLHKQRNPWASTLQMLLDEMRDWYTTKENLFKIGEACHPKGLGDTFVDGFDTFEWLDEVESLRNDCAVAFNDLELNGPQLSQPF